MADRKSGTVFVPLTLAELAYFKELVALYGRSVDDQFGIDVADIAERLQDASGQLCDA